MNKAKSILLLCHVFQILKLSCMYDFRVMVAVACNLTSSLFGDGTARNLLRHFVDTVITFLRQENTEMTPVYGAEIKWVRRLACLLHDKTQSQSLGSLGMWLVPWLHMETCSLTCVGHVDLNASGVASFPGRSRLQFLIACSMQKRSGKV